MDNPYAFCTKVSWSRETKIELFGHNENWYVWRSKGKTLKHKNIVPIVKHGGGSIMWHWYKSQKED